MLMALVLYTNVPALLFYGGRLLGETDENRRITLPADDSMLHYVWALPLSDGYLPCARAMELQKGELAMSGGAQVTQWAGGVYEVMLCLMERARAANAAPGSIAKQVMEDGAIATLYVSEAGGVHIAVENGDEMLFSKFITHGGRASLDYARFDDGELLCVYAQDKCVCVQKSSSCTLTVETPGQSFSRKGRQIICIEELPTVTGYERRTAFDGLSGARQSMEVGHFSRPARRIQNGYDAACALLEAVRFNVEADERKLLGGDLENISHEQLVDFFGEYTRLAMPPAQGGEGVCVGLLPDGAYARGRVFRFACDNSEGAWKVVNAEEI